MFTIIVPTPSHNEPVCGDCKVRIADGIKKKKTTIKKQMFLTLTLESLRFNQRFMIIVTAVDTIITHAV